MLRAIGYVGALAVLVGTGVLYQQAPGIAAGALLYPARNDRVPEAPRGCVDREFDGAGVQLRGWQCMAGAGQSRGTIVYLHGIADNRGSARGPIERFTRHGYDVIAYDSRAHGLSGGTACTYGYHEKSDLRRVLDTVLDGRIIVVGTSLGAAVALQAAAEDRRISGVVAAEVFSDLETIARERAPFFVWDQLMESAFRVAAQWGAFDVGSVSPEASARSIRVPVLLLHGKADTDTPPAHSQRVYGALTGPKRLVLVEGVRHNETLGNAEAWTEIDRWIDGIMRGM